MQIEYSWQWRRTEYHDFFLVAYFTTLLVSQTMLHRIVEWLANNKLNRIYKEATMT
jgi:hypothetical protein